MIGSKKTNKIVSSVDNGMTTIKCEGPEQKFLIYRGMYVVRSNR